MGNSWTIHFLRLYQRAYFQKQHITCQSVFQTFTTAASLLYSGLREGYMLLMILYAFVKNLFRQFKKINITKPYSIVLYYTLFCSLPYLILVLLPTTPFTGCVYHTSSAVLYHILVFHHTLGLDHMAKIYIAIYFFISVEYNTITFNYIICQSFFQSFLPE